MDQEFLLEAHRSVNSLLKKLALGLDRQALNKKVIALTEDLFGKRKASILLLDPSTQRLHLESAPNLPDFYNEAIEGVKIGVGIGSCGAAAALKKPVIVSNINEHPNWSLFLALTQRANLHACWSVPIISSHNQVLGTFAIYSDLPSSPGELETEILELLASLYSVALEKFAMETQLNFYANRDSLTHCYNRRALFSEAKKVMDGECFSGKVMSCLFVDIDKFKFINDNFGHKFGDQILTTVADTLSSVSSPCSKIGRYGGDEFVIFSCFTSEEVAQNYYLALNSKLKEVLLINEMQFSVSVGLACAKDEVNLDQLITLADKNMYKVKQAKSKW
ncbi:sensor domain-containing diguanylate cyclase [Vibrio gallaecicus]|uniref:diguanylate cyclase n=1 Tax=Vibrio gallaecicus TaxID=552386 RepID=A0ABV4NDS2_9VIBR